MSLDVVADGFQDLPSWVDEIDLAYAVFGNLLALNV
jgi:hypothetical protein